MSVDVAFMRTERGDEVTVTLFQHCGQAPTICISLDDPDQSLVPTMELTMDESTTLREVLRKFGEQVDRAKVASGR